MSRLFDFQPDDLRNLPTVRAAYSDRTALLMGRLAHRAYDMFDKDDASLAKFQATFGELGFKDFTPLVAAEVGTAGFVAASTDIVVIVFRGTQDDLDWQTNVRASWIELQGGTRVHMGFFQAYLPIREAMFAAVEQLVRKTPRPVYIAGHSLGGALATIATAELANHPEVLIRDSIAACYTFGSPRVGDSSFDLYVKVPLYRVTNGIDLVPAVPFAWMGYRHVGDTRYFGKRGTPPARHSINFVRKIWLTALGFVAFLRTMKIVNIRDHQTAAYVGKMLAWAKENIVETQERREKTADPEIAKR
jgi:predicted lipase